MRAVADGRHLGHPIVPGSGSHGVRRSLAARSAATSTGQEAGARTAVRVRAVRFLLVPGSYVVFLRRGAEGDEVLLHLRQGTGYMDGYWATIACHVERQGMPRFLW
jgi:hypothetical protein